MANGNAKVPVAGDSLLFDQTKTTAGQVPQTGTQTDSIDDIAGTTFANLTVGATFDSGIALQSNAKFNGSMDIRSGTFTDGGQASASLMLDSNSQNSVLGGAIFDNVVFYFGSNATPTSPKGKIQDDLFFRDGTKFKINGTVAWASGDISLYATCEITVQWSGVFDIQGDNKLLRPAGTGGASKIDVGGSSRSRPAGGQPSSVP